MLIKPLIVCLTLLAIIVLERTRPWVRHPLIVSWRNRSAQAWQRLVRNFGLFAVTSLTSLAVAIPVTSFGAAHGLGLRPEFLDGPLGLVFAILVLDCWIYWWHRFNHQVPLLWRFHRIHHLDGILDSSSALRFHFGEVALSAFARLPIIVLFAIPLAHVAVFEALVLASAIFHHSAFELPARLERALSRLIITPSIHWVHHHKLRRDTDSNYGTIFSFWDPLFKSRSRTVRWREMPIGVEHDGPDKSLPRLLIEPFTPQPRQNRHRSAPVESTQRG